MAMHNELWFPNVIWSSIIHVVNNDDLKKWAYDLKAVDKGRVLSNYGGWQSHDIKPGENIQIDRLVKKLNEEMDYCAKQVGLKTPVIYNIWININPPGAYNNLHHHIDSVLSGVYYVDASSDQGNIEFHRGDNAEYHIPQEAIEKTTYYTSSKATYAAKTGALYIFPGFLKHQVQGNFTNRDRISVSFNYGVDNAS